MDTIILFLEGLAAFTMECGKYMIPCRLIQPKNRVVLSLLLPFACVSHNHVDMALHLESSLDHIPPHSLQRKCISY
jgi:ferredoxin-thioredoxin reductase catalytic subunit